MFLHNNFKHSAYMPKFQITVIWQLDKLLTENYKFFRRFSSVVKFWSLAVDIESIFVE